MFTEPVKSWLSSVVSPNFEDPLWYTIEAETSSDLNSCAVIVPATTTSPAKVAFPAVLIVKTVPVPSESDKIKSLLACTFVKTQFPVFAPKVKDELLLDPLTINDVPVTT